MSVATISYAGYYYYGGAMGFCDHVNRINPSVVTAAGFWEYPIVNTNNTTLIRAYDSQTYAFRTLVIGYPLSDNSLVRFDGDFLQNDPSYIICNTSRYLDPCATNVLGYGLGSFYGGRSKE